MNEKNQLILLRSSPTGEMVLYHPNENRIILNKKLFHKCSLCGTRLQDLRLDEEYFNILEDHPFSDQMNQGYYDRFFVELQKLGRGQRGSVFLCRHTLDNVELGLFAVKAVPVGESHSWLVKMLREVTLLGKLKHPNIIEYKHAWLENRQLHTFGPEVPCLFILMELANGGNVEEYIHLQNSESSRAFEFNPAVNVEERLRKKRERARSLNGIPAEWPQTLHKDCDIDQIKRVGGIAIENQSRKRYLTAEEILSFFLDICQGLAHLHKNKIIHRDLKPPNLLLKYDDDSKTGIPKVLISDFGECQLFTEDIERQRSGATGTLEFMPPELLKQDGKGNYIPNNDHHADMWSLGVVLHFLCYSTVPYSQTDDVLNLKQEILEFDCTKMEFERLERIHPLYEDLIRELMDYEASNRPNVDQVIEKVMGIQSTSGSRGPPPFESAEISDFAKRARRKSAHSPLMLPELPEATMEEVEPDADTTFPLSVKIQEMPAADVNESIVNAESTDQILLFEVVKLMSLILSLWPIFYCTNPSKQIAVLSLGVGIAIYICISLKRWVPALAISGLSLSYYVHLQVNGLLCQAL